MAGPTYDNKVIIVTGSPITVADLNTAIAARNTAGYWVSFIQFIDANTAALLSVLNDATAYGYPATQKVNQVAANQTAVDTDKGTEAALNYVPTGLSVLPGGSDVLIVYTLNPYAQ